MKRVFQQIALVTTTAVGLVMAGEVPAIAGTTAVVADGLVNAIPATTKMGEAMSDAVFYPSEKADTVTTVTNIGKPVGTMVPIVDQGLEMMPGAGGLDALG